MKPQKQKGIALITVIALIVVIFSFSLALSVVIDKNLKFFSFSSQKATAHSLAKTAMEYITVKGINIVLPSGTTTTGEIQVDPARPYYFEIRQTGAEYQFIGIVKGRAGGREIARTTLRVLKPATDFKNSWTE